MSPDQEADYGDSETGCRDKSVAEQPLARERGHEFRCYAHGRQDHDVNGRMRIKPEQMLEQQRVATRRRIEDRQMEDPFNRDQNKRDSDDWRAKNHNQSSGVVGPDE